MQKLLQFAQNNEIEVTKETVSGFLLNLHALQADGTTVCTIADLNKIGIDIILEREGREAKYIYQGYLEDLLVGMYSQSTKFNINKTKLSDGYKMMIDFAPAVIRLTGKDVLRVKLKAENISFTSLSNVQSSIDFETIPAFGGQTVVPVLNQFPLGAGESAIDKAIGDNVVKVTLLTDLGADYASSTEAKPVSIDIFANGYEKSVSEALLQAENIHYLDNNPETPIQDLVVYSGSSINNVRVKTKLDKPALAEAKLLVITLENI